MADEVEVQARLGLRTGLIAMDARSLPWANRIRDLVVAGLAEVVSPRRPVTARLLVLRQPRLFAEPGWRLAARGDRTVMVANQVPQDGASEVPYYDVRAVMERLEAELGVAPEWAPTGPVVRQSLADGPELTAFDWHSVIDVGAWARPRSATCDSPYAIGRHSPDEVSRWPDDRKALLAAYPKSGEWRVRILGGTDAAAIVLGRRPPRSWQVFDAAPQEFLASLDAYVYFHHAGLREGFGRSVLEALASGLPVVTHPYFEPLFGDACLYGDPHDAPRLALDLLRRGRVNDQGLALVRERYGWETHRRRLDHYLASSLQSVRRSRRRSRVLFMSSNGGGMGHLTRLLAIARRLPEEQEPVFLTMSTAIEAVRKEGFWVDYMPSSGSFGLGNAEWSEYLRARVVTAVRTLRPTALVFDGTYAYGGLIQAMGEFPDLFRVWSRRGMWKPVSDLRRVHSMTQLAAFDLVLEPGDLAAEADRGATADHRGAVRVIDPIVYLDEGELLSREAARAELGIPPGVTSGLINLGAGNINRLDAVLAAIAEMLGRYPDVHLVGAQSLISQRRIPIDPSRITPLETYPLSRVLRAFDFCIAAPGYNSFHELLAHAVPTLFIPNQETTLDDQLARAEWASRRGLCLLGCETDGAQLARAVTELMRSDVRESLRTACAGLPSMRGAHMAAELIAAGSPSRLRAAWKGSRPPLPSLPLPRRHFRLPRSPAGAWRMARRMLRRAGSAMGALRRAGDYLPWVKSPVAKLLMEKSAAAAPASRVLLVADGTLWPEPRIETMVDWGSARGAVILAPANIVPRLLRAGLTAELITERDREEIDDRLDFAAYWNQKTRVVRVAYRCDSVICWGSDHWPTWLLLDGDRRRED